MTPSDFAAQIRYRTRTNSTTFPDADLLRILNKHKDKICKKAIKMTNEDLFVVPATASLVANQREYALPSDLIALRRVEVSFDGSEWIKLLPFDLSNIAVPTTEAEITATFSNIDSNAYYDLMRRSIVIYSGTIIAVTNGLKIWHEIMPADVSDLTGAINDLSADPTTTSFGIPVELQEILEDAIVIEYKTHLDKPLSLTERETLFDVHLAVAIHDLKNSNRDKEIKGSVPNDAGSTGDRGFEL